MPRELVMLRYVDRFGLGIFGRAPGAGELKRMITAERVVQAYQAREKASNWVEWSKNNPQAAGLLNLGLRLNNGE